MNLFYQLHSKPLIHQRDFRLKYILDILLLHVVEFLCHYYTMFKDLAF